MPSDEVMTCLELGLGLGFGCFKVDAFRRPN